MENQQMQNQHMIPLLKVAAAAASASCGGGDASGYSKGKVSYTDYDKINSELMIHTIASLMNSLNPNFDEELQKTNRLMEFEQFGVCNSMTYDSYPDEVFHAARRFFPPNDKRLDLGLLLCPQQDVKRAKAVICYLTDFALLSDSLHETFQQEWDNLNDQNQQKIKLYDEIEELKNEIANEIQNLQCKKDEKPSLEQEHGVLEQELNKQKTDLNNLEDSCKSDRKHYDDIDAVNKRLQANISSLNMEKLTLENQLVKAAPQLLQQHAAEKQKVKEERKKRDVMGEELRQLGYKLQKLGQLIARSNSAVKKFEELIATLQTATENMNEISKLKKDLEFKSKECEGIQKAIKQMEADHERWEQQYNNRIHSFNQEISEYDHRIHQKTCTLEELEYRLNETNSQVEESEHEAQCLIREMQVLDSQQHEIQHYLGTVLPAKVALLEQRVGLYLQICDRITNSKLKINLPKRRRNRKT